MQLNWVVSRYLLFATMPVIIIKFNCVGLLQTIAAGNSRRFRLTALLVISDPPHAP